MFLNRLIG